MVERYCHSDFFSCSFNMKYIFLLVISALQTRGSLLGQIQDVGRQVVQNMHGGLEELGNVASVLAHDFGDGLKTVR